MPRRLLAQQDVRSPLRSHFGGGGGGVPTTNNWRPSPGPPRGPVLPVARPSRQPKPQQLSHRILQLASLLHGLELDLAHQIRRQVQGGLHITILLVSQLSVKLVVSTIL